MKEETLSDKIGGVSLRNMKHAILDEDVKEFIQKLKVDLCLKHHRHNIPKELGEKTTSLCGYCPTTMTIKIIAKERNYEPADIKKEMDKGKSYFSKCSNCEKIDKLSGSQLVEDKDV